MDIHTWSDKDFKGTVVYRTSINRGLLEITLTITVVLKGHNTSPSQRDNSDNFIQKTGEMNEQKINIIYNKDSNSQALCWNLKLESSKNKNQNKKSFFYWTIAVVYFNTIQRLFISIVISDKL